MHGVVSPEAFARPEVATFVTRAEERGCARLSDLDELVRALGADEEDVDSLESYLETLGIDITDDCGRDGVEPTAFRNGELAAATTDALQLCLNEIRRYPRVAAPRPPPSTTSPEPCRHDDRWTPHSSFH